MFHMDFITTNCLQPFNWSVYLNQKVDRRQNVEILFAYKGFWFVHFVKIICFEGYFAEKK